MFRTPTLIIALIGCLPAFVASGGHINSPHPSPEHRTDASLSDTTPAAGMLLVARRNLTGPVFGRTVILLLNHDEDGSIGLVLNRRLESTLSSVISGVDGEADRLPMFFGGPVGTHQVYMLLRNNEPIPDAQHITADIYFSAARPVLDEMLERQVSGSKLHLYIGYAGWGAGQLATEIEGGSWELAESDPDAIFEASDHRLWQRLIDKLEPIGIEVRLDHADKELLQHADASLYR